jgi:hypothetical protein
LPNTVLDYLDILLTKLMIRSIRRGYGGDCPTSDLEDLSETYTKPDDVFASGRCASCRAKEVIDWLEGHLELMRD